LYYDFTIYDYTIDELIENIKNWLLIIKSDKIIIMKKLIALFAAISLSIAVYAQKAEEIKVSALPKTTTSWITQNFKGGTIERAAKVTDGKKVIGYCASVEADKRKMILVFDKNGKYLNRVKKMADIEGVLKPAPVQTQPPKKK